MKSTEKGVHLMSPEVIGWGIVLLFFIVGEGISVGLTSIWFGVGALGGLICAALGLGMLAQLIAFIVLSGISLILLRPVAKRMLSSKVEATNADRIIGKTAIVTEEIDNLKATGLANVAGQVWTARSEGEVIPAGTLVEILRIEGVKIIVQVSNSGI